jgi:hypothetical protein
MRKRSSRIEFVVTYDFSSNNLSNIPRWAKHYVALRDAFANNPQLPCRKTSRNLACSGFHEMGNPFIAEVTHVLRKLSGQVFEDVEISADESLGTTEVRIATLLSEHHFVKASSH